MENKVTKEKYFELAVEAIIKLGYDELDAEFLVNEHGLDEMAAEMIENEESVAFWDEYIEKLHRCYFNNGELDDRYLQRRNDRWHIWHYLALDGEVYAYNPLNGYNDQEYFDVDEFLEMCDRPEEGLTLDDFNGNERRFERWKENCREWEEFKEDVRRKTNTIK